MNNKIQRLNRIITLILCLTLMITIGGDIFSAFSITASAAETVEYSNVLDDLKKDSSFNPDDYPAKADDYSLQVIQIAEGANGELFVYVYQPNFSYTGNKASYINISFQDQRDPSEALKYERKSLVFLNSNGVFCKYLLYDFTVPEQTIRYYSVAAIYRPYIEGVDKTYEAIDSKQHVKTEVGKLWSACLYNGVLEYGAFEIDVVDVDITASGDIYYKNGLQGFYLSGCNSHYFAFKVTNYDVTEIYDADVTYNLVPYWERVSSLKPTIDNSREEIIVESKSIYSSEHVIFEPDGLFAKKATWKRIQTVEEFLSDAEKQGKEFSDSELADIKKSQFVFRVVESDYTITLDTYGDHIYQYYRLEDSGVLRLHFATSVGVFNLGAVSDLVGTDGKSDSKDNNDNDEWFEKIIAILMIIAIAIIIIAFSPLFKVFVDFFVGAIKFLFELLIWIVLFPFRLIRLIFTGKWK